MMISSALATACGIGGGTVYSSIMLGVQEFEPSEAFPISNCLILICMINYTQKNRQKSMKKFIKNAVD